MLVSATSAGAGSVNWAAVVVLGIPVVALYLLPTWIGWARRTRQMPAIVLVNVLLGWTVIGWVAALVLSVWKYEEKESAPPTENPPAGDYGTGPTPERTH